MRQLRPFVGFFTIATCTSVLALNSAYANKISRADLKGLATQFVHRLAPKIKKNGSHSSSHYQLSLIPDGEPLLFRPKIGNIVYDLDMLAVKQKDGIYISFYDLISVFEFPISYDEETQTAFGWFLREDWNFNLNIPQKTLTSKGRDFTLHEKDIFLEEGELYIHKSALEQWFDMKYEMDISQQYIKVQSDYPLPKVARHHRRLREDQRSRASRVARLPRQNVAYDNFDLNLADITLRSSYRKTSPSRPQPNRNSANIALEGELLKHSAYGLTTLDNQQGLHTITARLKKESEDPSLLGPLKARSYTVGDSSTTRLPLTGSTGQELGLNISNNPLSNSNFETTEIEGDALPGWDVELYRNGGLVSSQTINETGRYRFENIQLFGGENTFELFFYGPQGEIRADNIHIPVNEALLSTQNNTYEFSASLSDERTYQKRPSGDIDAGTVHLSGKYNFFLGDALSYAGFRSRQVEGEQKLFVGAGVTKIIKNAILDANFAADEEGETAGELTARTKIKDWNIALSGEVRSDAYAPDGAEDPNILQTDLSITKTYAPWIGTRGNIAGNITHRESAQGTEIDTQRFTLSNGFGRLNLSNTLSHITQTDEAERLEDTLSMRYQQGKIFMRGGVEYDIKPERKIDRYFSHFSYRPTPKVTADLRLDHEPDRHFSEGRLNLTYIHDKVRFSPFLEIDSNDEIFAGLNLNTTLIHEDSLKSPLITSERLIGRGFVSAFVYHDKNGDRIFNEEDIPLPDVVVESINVRKREKTNKDGYSLVRGLPNAHVTDIHVDQSTLPDPFMISAIEGHSIFPRGGDIVSMEFPIHIAGELDGTVSIQKKNGKQALARLLRVQLIPTSGDLDKVQTVKTAGDGFFVFSQIPPGDYFLTPVYEDLKNLKAGQPAPEPISIGYDGTVIYGKNIILSELVPPTQIKMKQDGSSSYLLNVGHQGKSTLSTLLNKIMARRAPSPLLSRLTRTTIKDKHDLNVERYLTPSGTLKESFDLCQKLIQDKMPCAIEQAMVEE